jgi:TetR/AcrR family transcriptional repressor of nem operon
MRSVVRLRPFGIATVRGRPFERLFRRPALQERARTPAIPDHTCSNGLDKFKTTGHITLMPKPNVREEILTAGLAALHHRGFNATSVQDITEAAGVPKGSFYNHFASKEELGAAVVQLYSDKGEERRRALKDRRVPPLGRLRRYFEGLADMGRYPDAAGCLLGNFGAELSNQSPAIRAQVSVAFVEWAGAVAEVIDEAQRAGDISGDQTPQALAAFIIDAWEGAVMRGKVEQSRAPVDAFLAMIFTKVLA